MDIKESKRHQLLQAVRILSTIIQFNERRYDFASEDGKELLEEAKAACAVLEAEVNELYPSHVGKKEIDAETISNTPVPSFADSKSAIRNGTRQGLESEAVSCVLKQESLEIRK